MSLSRSLSKGTSFCDHGIVVKHLRRCLQEQGHSTGKDRFRDLYVHRKGRITSLFEVKTDTSTASIYSAVGQFKPGTNSRRSASGFSATVGWMANQVSPASCIGSSESRKSLSDSVTDRDILPGRVWLPSSPIRAIPLKRSSPSRMLSTPAYAAPCRSKPASRAGQCHRA